MPNEEMLTLNFNNLLKSINGQSATDVITGMKESRESVVNDIKSFLNDDKNALNLALTNTKVKIDSVITKMTEANNKIPDQLDDILNNGFDKMANDVTLQLNQSNDTIVPMISDVILALYGIKHAASKIIPAKIEGVFDTGRNSINHMSNDTRNDKIADGAYVDRSNNDEITLDDRKRTGSYNNVPEGFAPPEPTNNANYNQPTPTITSQQVNGGTKITINLRGNSGGDNTLKAIADVNGYNTSLNSVAPKIDRRLMNAFNAAGLKVTVTDDNFGGEGVFSRKDGGLVLRSEHTNDGTAYHELGHFLADIAGVTRSDMKDVYDKEREKFFGTFYMYANSSASEFFGESMKLFTENNDRMKKEMPQTYALIEKALNSINEEKIKSYKAKVAGGYASGTSRASRGVHKVNENGLETFVTKSGTYMPFSGGEGVIPAKETARLTSLVEMINSYAFSDDIQGMSQDVETLKKAQIMQIEQLKMGL